MHRRKPRRKNNKALIVVEGLPDFPFFPSCQSSEKIFETYIILILRRKLTFYKICLLN